MSSSSACESFNGGHNVHWIQAKLAMENRLRPPIEVAEIEIDGLLVTLVLSDGQRREVWIHDTQRLAALRGQPATVRSHAVLAVRGQEAGSTTLFSMGSLETHRCGSERPVTGPVRWQLIAPSS